jgi:hypothetical protein
VKRPVYRYADEDNLSPDDLRHALAIWAELLVRAADRDPALHKEEPRRVAIVASHSASAQE